MPTPLPGWTAQIYDTSNTARCATLGIAEATGVNEKEARRLARAAAKAMGWTLIDFYRS